MVDDLATELGRGHKESRSRRTVRGRLMQAKGLLTMRREASDNTNGTPQRLDHGRSAVGVGRLIDTVLTQSTVSIKTRLARPCYSRPCEARSLRNGEGGIRTRGTC